MCVCVVVVVVVAIVVPQIAAACKQQKVINFSNNKI